MTDPTQGQKGDQGEQGIRGRQGPALSRAKGITMFVFVAVCFVLLGGRTEVNSGRIQDDAATACARVNQNSAAINNFADILINAYKSSTTIPPKRAERFVAEYQAMKVSLLDCTERGWP